MHYIVTGGAGFIGSHLVEALIGEGDEVTVLDNYSTGKKENIHPKAIVKNIDIRSKDEVKPLFHGVDGIFHLAALPRVQLSIEDPVTTNEHNVTTTVSVLTAAHEAGVKRVVYSASSSAYGDVKTMPLKENLPANPMSPYGLQKYIGEEYCKLFSQIYNLETVCLRYFNVYGPKMADTGAYLTVIKVMLKQHTNGEPLTITGDGTQTRDFTHVRDVARANILAMKSDKVGRGEAVNIGAGRGVSINTIAELIGGEKKYIPARLEPHDTLADNRRAKELLNWEPQEKLEDAIEELKQGKAKMN
ncbi:MAG: hypothetical protein COU08_02535 [Candidatus Harrisonbacteria bacterium CG10_big_fil_rev_8_21_14_0_10_42_17]|uniref:UDP-glucose 4-epimerase n=1 Tax=Candidatus Harrisonbacteria bacterium CG10_big_fil_rev_8_21_14_0_10_42_17 TaxID=1974584 RepID=A0A2M6WHS7_9BACT|nr:MAG: hypothetical protein COU08_02535 [Candidatus Harrisonbacteria bacterium CG10_big_fil_rev_8_21_14_0_10_42_17]